MHGTSAIQASGQMSKSAQARNTIAPETAARTTRSAPRRRPARASRRDSGLSSGTTIGSSARAGAAGLLVAAAVAALPVFRLLRLAMAALLRRPVRDDHLERCRQEADGGGQETARLAVRLEPDLVASDRLGPHHAGAALAHLVHREVAAAVHLAPVPHVVPD